MTASSTTTVPHGWVAPNQLVRKLAPLWRHVAALAALFAIVGAGAMVRLEVQQLRKDLDRTSKAILDATVLNDRLTLEGEARRRAAALEAAAFGMNLSASARLDTVERR